MELKKAKMICFVILGIFDNFIKSISTFDFITFKDVCINVVSYIYI